MKSCTRKRYLQARKEIANGQDSKDPLDFGPENQKSEVRIAPKVLNIPAESFVFDVFEDLL